MRLEEVARMLSTSRTRDDVDWAARRTGEHLGTGYYGAVYDRPGDVNQVTKVARAHPKTNDLARDGYVAFVEKVMSSRNPYFPQVGELKKYTSRTTGEQFFTLQLERLVPMIDCDVEELKVLFHRMTGRSYSRNMSNTYQRGTMWKGTIEQAIANVVSDAVEGGSAPASIVDPQLREAVRVLANMRRQGWEVDLHGANMMCRRTPYGLQLVITDPFVERRQPNESSS